MGDNNLMPGFNQVRDGFGGLLDSLHLLRQIFTQRIAAQSNDDTFTHSCILVSNHNHDDGFPKKSS